MPNTLPPNKRRARTIRPMRGPAIYQGHGRTGSIVIVMSGCDGKNTTCLGIHCGFTSSTRCSGVAKRPYNNSQRPRPRATRTPPSTSALWPTVASSVAVTKGRSRTTESRTPACPAWACWLAAGSAKTTRVGRTELIAGLGSIARSESHTGSKKHCKASHVVTLPNHS